ncbi:hypothetical protein [Sediminitomix flava]|uniref:Uncharacterized protein n=1 Tax=Sediminitomix flava TaxID=379075 RepID=A0A315Z828_SEDFL|nr:hypothetical protein [Sediminitomix flava]PWJ40818.1 hypothetical protein BC781_10477 [Sediminitomix flava]
MTSKLNENEKPIAGKSFLSDELAQFLIGKDLLAADESRLLYLHREHNIPVDKLITAYQKQQELIEKYKEDFIEDESPEIEEEVPPMIIKLVNPLIVEMYTSEEQLATYIIKRESE